MGEMSRAEKFANLGAVVVPFAATIAAIVLLWNSFVTPADLIIAAVMYILTAVGITVGFHRQLTHRSFQTSKALEYTFAVLGSMAVQGPVIAWVADHRKHHAHTDEEGDPHSPHVAEDGHHQGVLRGLWHAHSGWLMSNQGRADWKKYARDLYEDNGMRIINRRFPVLVYLTLAIPALAGFLVTGTAVGALTGLLWGGLVRIFFVHHITWSVNSVCHFLGTRRFDTDDHSTNVFWLALPSLGESWHHNHHAFPRSAVHGMKRWEPDPSGLIISGMEKVGLARNVIRISPERQAERTRENSASVKNVSVAAMPLNPPGDSHRT
jgi:stearoyl-CoA desaturase (delta-9 desaturase)